MVTLKSEVGELNADFTVPSTPTRFTPCSSTSATWDRWASELWDSAIGIHQVDADRKMNVRLSYYRSINRPGFYEIVPYQIQGEEYQEKGNPNLKRARIDNIDLRWEWLPSKTEQILAGGVFYKYLKDPIEQVFVTSDGKIGATDAYYMPDNLGNAKNMGFEIDVIKYIRHFGVKANYTYTHSEITTSKREYKEGDASINRA